MTLHATQRFADALGRTTPRTRSQLYWVARVCLVSDIRQLDTFDAVFDVIFEGDALPTGREARKRESAPPAREDSDMHLRLGGRSEAVSSGGGVPWTSAPSAAGDEDDDVTDEHIVLPDLLPASLAALADRSFDSLLDSELAEIGRWLESATIQWPTRRVRRMHAWHSGRELDRRETLRRAHKTGGDPFELVWRTRHVRPRKVVMLADVSGSMQTFVRPYMHVMRALATHTQAEVFAFATSITRITPALRRNDPADAIEAASQLVEDRFAGTRIATSLRELQRHPTWSTALRGAVVLIASDGWDTDPADMLSERMSRLARLANRIVWVNPRSAAHDFEPLVAGMAAALPHCDVMLSGHTLRAMHDVLVALAHPRGQLKVRSRFVVPNDRSVGSDR